MNRSQLFNEMWKLMVRNSAMWIVALIGLGIGTVVGLLLTGPSVALAIINTIVGFLTTAFVTGALIDMVNASVEGKGVTVNDGIQAGTRKLVPLVFVRLALMVPIWIVILLFTGSFLAMFGPLGRPGGLQVSNLTGFVSGAVGFAIVTLIVTALVTMINVGADRAVVLEGLSVFAALKRGWQMVQEHLSDFIVIGLMMFVVAIAISLLFGCTIGALLSSAVIGQVASGNFVPTAVASSPAVWIAALVGLIISVVLEVLFSGVWTMAFRKWQGR